MSFKHISNSLARFFYIVYADRGFVGRGGRVDTRLFNVCFVLITLALALRQACFLFYKINLVTIIPSMPNKFWTIFDNAEYMNMYIDVLLFVFFSGFLGFRLAAPLMSPEYPANTVMGRCCSFWLLGSGNFVLFSVYRNVTK